MSFRQAPSFVSLYSTSLFGSVNIQVPRRASASQISGATWVTKSDHRFIQSKIRLRVLSQGHDSENSVKTGERTNTPDELEVSQESLTDSKSALPKLVASLSVIAGIGALLVGGLLLKDQIKAFLDTFILLVDQWGPLGYLAYIAVYAILELLAVPAIPLTMTAGVIFGVLPGTAVVSISSTLAATGAFLISRYIARDRVVAWASKNPKFAAIDKAIGKEGLKVVTLLRLSPLLPLAASNYIYGITSVDLGSYVLGSCIGMLPGTFAYVAAGAYGKEYLIGGEGGLGVQPWQLALGLGFTALALWYIGNVAKKALQD